MLSWGGQKELVRALWTEPFVHAALAPVIRASHFERPDLGWIAKTLATRPFTPGSLPITVNELLDDMSLTTAPHILEACKSLIPEIEKAEKLDPVRAIETGRKFLAHQEFLTLAGQLGTLAMNGAWGEIRVRMEEGLSLAGAVVLDEEKTDGLVVRKASSFVSEKIDWLWPGFIPYGKVSTMEGNGGLGKSTVMLDMVARVSQGYLPPLSTELNSEGLVRNVPADAVVLSAEDGASDTIRPRLEAAGADLDRVHLVSGVNETTKTNGKTETNERSVALDRDVMRLENLVVKTGARLVVIDPIVAMLGGTVDFHRDQDVRRVLKALAGLAERRKCAVVTIRHLNKDKSGDLISRGGGSIGFVAAVRTAMIVVKHPASDEDRVVAVYKTNLSKLPQPVIYRFKPVKDNPDIATIDWMQRSTRTIEELVNPGSTP